MTMFLIVFLCLSDNGVIIVDNVWFYGADGRSRILNIGDQIEIIEKNDDLIVTRYDNVIGKLHKDVLIDLRDQIGEDMLFVFARGYFDEREFKNAVKLLDIFIKYFDKSKYLAEVLYYCGLSHEELAKTFNNSHKIEEIILNEQSNQWYYSGKVYEKILKDFPESNYAAKANYRLIKIFRIKNLPWHNTPQSIAEELKMWLEFINKYKNSEEYVEALLEIGYLQRVLFQTTKDPNYQEEAIAVFQKIIKKYPDSVYSAQAKINLYEIEKGEDVYYF